MGAEDLARIIAQAAHGEGSEFVSAVLHCRTDSKNSHALRTISQFVIGIFPVCNRIGE